MPNGTTAQIDATRLLIWEYGRPAELWRSHRYLAAEMVKKHKLKPLPIEEYPYLPLAAELGSTAVNLKATSRKKAVQLRWPIPFPGGIGIPHLHLGNDIYLVQAKQWQQFSQAVVTDIRKRLDGAKEIGFDQMLQLGQGTASLTR